MKVTNDLTFTLLRKGLDALSARNTVIANNIANIETPNYKAADVAFEDSLRRAIVLDAPNLRLTETDPAHLNRRGEQQQRLEELHHRTFRRNDTSMRKDGNNVDVENEMIRLAETGLNYQAMSTLATKKLALMRMVIQETR
jgi:flagellar basal-body rod protein FlgB